MSFKKLLAKNRRLILSFPCFSVSLVTGNWRPQDTSCEPSAEGQVKQWTFLVSSTLGNSTWGLLFTAAGNLPALHRFVLAGGALDLRAAPCHPAPGWHRTLWVILQQGTCSRWREPSLGPQALSKTQNLQLFPQEELRLTRHVEHYRLVLLEVFEEQC